MRQSVVPSTELGGEFIAQAYSVTLLLALDQGTTSTRAIAFDAALVPVATAQVELPQHFPAPGWVEHEPEDIASHSLRVLREALDKAGGASADVAGIGITNQRETTVLWERATGRAVGRAPVWQDRRTAALCESLRAAGHEELVTARTGLLLDPYFSATKLAWLLDNTPGARAAAERGELCFGTVDSFLLFRLTEGRVHATDATNAARTLLFDIRRGVWDEEMLALFNIPRAILPEVRDCATRFGETRLLGGSIPILGMAGDQQAATIGQACFEPGMIKSTYGTGCFALLVTGEEAVASTNRLLTTIAWQLDGRRAYALEGSIFMAGATVQWLRDGLGIIAKASEAGELAARPTRRSACISCPPSPGSARPGGMRRRAAPSSASPAPRAAPRSAGPRWRAWRCRPPTSSTPCAATGPAWAIRCCAWTAAWSPATGPCSSSPTSSAPRWTGRWCRRRRRWVPPISPASRRGCCRRPATPPPTGGATAASCRAWRAPRRIVARPNGARRSPACGAG
jgi:glycerol kinase